MKIFKFLMAIALSSTLIGCSSTNDQKKTFTFASELDIKNLDSSDADDGMSFNAMHACIDGLMGLDKDGNIVGAIAESYDVSDDRLTYTFHLREDANWSNGDPVTAHDFVYAWQRILKNNGNYGYMLGSDGAAIKGVDEILDKMANNQKVTDKDYAAMGVKAQEDKTLVVTTTRAISYFEELMTFPCYYPINQKFCEEKGDQYAKSADNVLSNGAFIMTDWQPNRVATFKKNDKYYNADEVKLDELVMNLVQDPQTAAMNFESGENDFAPINSNLIDKYKDKDYYKTFNEGYLFYLQLNMKKTDLQNANIRKALSLAIDRDDLTENVLKDGSKAATGFVPSQLSISGDGNDFRTDAGSYTSYNIDEANKAMAQGLKELGKSSITLRLTYGTDESPMDQMAEYLQNSYSKLKGLTIEMVATTKQDRIYTKQANGEFDIACTRWGPDYGDPTTYLNLTLTGNKNNYGKYSNSKYDAKMKEAQSLSDSTKRWQALIEAEKIMMEDMPDIPVFEKGTAVLQNTKTTGLVHRPVGVPYTFAYVDVMDK